MTEVIFTQNADHKITGFTSQGHAEFARKGKDVVCAAISVLTINAVNSIEKIAKADADVLEDSKEGLIKFRLLSEPDDKTETILRSLILGLKGVVADYGGRYCKVIIEEEEQC